MKFDYSKRSVDYQHQHVFTSDSMLLSQEEFDEICGWCEQTFGRDWQRWDRPYLNRFVFRDESDAVMFRLQWT